VAKLQERLHVSAFPGAISVLAFRTVLADGCLSVNLAQLLNDIGEAGGKTPAQAIGPLRRACANGELRFYGATAEVLDHDVLHGGMLGQVWITQELSQTRVTPVCKYLTWPVLRAVLYSFRREHIRPCLDLVLDTCRCAFLMECDVLDVLVAVALSPPGVCRIEHARWPTTNQVPNAHAEALILESTMLTLTEDPKVDGANPVPGSPSTWVGFRITSGWHRRIRRKAALPPVQLAFEILFRPI